MIRNKPKRIRLEKKHIFKTSKNYLEKINDRMKMKENNSK